jgi:hypothetical protein
VAEPNRLATEQAIERGHDRERLWKALERFANCGDSVQEYNDLAKAYPDLWPVEIRNKERACLNWTPAAHRLFLRYRDALRLVWEGDLPAIRRGNVAFLLGVNAKESLSSRGVYESPSGRVVLPVDGAYTPKGVSQAWLDLERQHPSAKPGMNALFWPNWETGDFFYSSQNNFQRGFYSLFCERWRARVCPICKVYFLAQKPRQTFCSLSCSNRSRLRSNLDWWNRIGAARRKKHAQKTKRRRR